jgi:hypothetical protein
VNGTHDGRRHLAGPSLPADAEITRDLSAFATETSRDIPPIHETMRRARNRAEGRARRFPMAAIRFLWLRPTVSTLVAVAIGLFVVFGLPISFDKTVGHDIRLDVSGASLDQAGVLALAREMKEVLGAEGVQVEADAEGGTLTYQLSASVPERSMAAARGAAEALAATLRDAGYSASAEVKARTERVSGTVYAYASDRVIRISTDGKSASQLESEIRDGLMAAGFRDAQVSVTDEGADGKRIEIRAEHEGAPGEAEGEMPEVVLTVEGEEIQGQSAGQCTVKVKKLKDESGALKLVVDVAEGGRTATAEIPNPDSAGDSAIRSAIQAELDRAGIDARVEVTNGEVRVESR